MYFLSCVYCNNICFDCTALFNLTLFVFLFFLCDITVNLSLLCIMYVCVCVCLWGSVYMCATVEQELTKMPLYKCWETDLWISGWRLSKHLKQCLER